jgi:SsrA-binding protein
MPKKLTTSEIALNKKGLFDHEIIEEHEAGIQLFGWEVRSLREHGAQLHGSYISIRGGVARLVHIHPYKFARDTDVGVKRDRSLFLRKNTMLRLEQKVGEAGMTVIPKKIYYKGNLIKVSVALVRGRKQYDKRELLKKRDVQRDVMVSIGKIR